MGYYLIYCYNTSAGIGKVKNRDNATLWGTDQEHKLRCPDDPFFKKFAAEASRVQIAVDVFVLGCAGRCCMRSSPEQLGVLPCAERLGGWARLAVACNGHWSSCIMLTVRAFGTALHLDIIRLTY